MNKTTLKTILLTVVAIYITGCVATYYPKKQKVSINTQNSESKVYIDNEEIGKGSTVTKRIKKLEARQVVLETPEYKNSYYAMVPYRLNSGFWMLYSLNFMNWGWGYFADLCVPKMAGFNMVNDMVAKTKYPKRGPDDKYIELTAIKVNMKNKSNDIINYTLNYKTDLLEQISKVEKKKLDSDNKQVEKNSKQKKGKTLDEDDNKINFENTKFSENLEKILLKGGYIDTINRVFSDNNNTLSLEGTINKAYIYRINGMLKTLKNNSFYKVKFDINWYIKNTFGEILDSLETNDLSGDFVINDLSESDALNKPFKDAIEIAFINVLKDDKLAKYQKVEKTYNTKDELLTINSPADYVKELTDATNSSVIVKNNKKHGSGFAISTDGYIITNFHVIASNYYDKTNKIEVVLSNQQVLNAKLIRYNRMRDIALLKVDYNFEKPFKLSMNKSYKTMQEVYTLGAPKSVELGQSVSMGLISNERNVNNISLLQLNMSVNSGNSGGPLFDKSGNLHGVIVSKLTGFSTEGISFAIPSYLLCDYLKISIIN